MLTNVLPYRPEFPQTLAGYCEQIQGVIKRGGHHDQRRALLLNFLREAFGIESAEVELERKIKAAEVSGRIDAFWRHLIIEVKTDLERERADAQAELKKYFEAQRHPLDYLGLVTDGLRFEVYLYESQQAGVRLISGFALEAGQPLHAFRHLDQVFFTGQRLAPTSGDIVVRLGQHSAVFNASLRHLGALYDAVAADSTVQTKFREWNTLLAKVYGSPLGDRTLFLKHTYLVMVSRAIVAAALAPAQVTKAKDFRGLVDGEFFRALGIQNLAEPDFFSWALDTPSEAGFCDFVHQLLGSLRVYDFAKLDEDILKELYQGLVDPDQRHDLGEYYTPDWLAELTLEQIGYQGGKLLDPSCGSGGFLFAAVQRLKASGLKGKKLAQQVLEEVIGLDIHPVAVLMAKANLLLSLEEPAKTLGRGVSLRIYMADTLMSDVDVKKEVLLVPASDVGVFHVPLATAETENLDALVDQLSALAHRSVANASLRSGAEKAAQTIVSKLPESQRMYWSENFRLFARLEQQRRNTVWAYILKNAYRPVFLRREKVDYVAGNPPWLSLRYVKDKSYKQRIKDLTFSYGLLAKTDVKLFTQMDTSTLFFVHCQREFLKPDGTIAFVLPKTAILPAKQHAGFQRLGFTKVHDFTGVTPLFNVRTCVVIRDQSARQQDIPQVSWTGTLTTRNASLASARNTIGSKSGVLKLLGEVRPQSDYFEKFLNGASLYPRCACFVEPQPDTPLIREAPMLQTAEEAWKDSKPEWRFRMKGQVNADYLYATVLSKNLVPFVVRKLSLVALPLIQTSHGDLKMVDASYPLSRNQVEACDWFGEAERRWNQNRKDPKQSFQDRLDYGSLLTRQDPREKFIVLYNSSGTNVSAALVTAREARSVGGIPTRGFVVENVCYRYYAASEGEALYLVGVLNSSVVNEAIKPYQPQGLLGERHIHRRPFEACAIPLFDPKNVLHQRIAEVTREARAELLPLVPRMQTPVATARADARRLVAGKFAQLDVLVGQLLGSQPTKYPETATEPMRLLELFQ